MSRRLKTLLAVVLVPLAVLLSFVAVNAAEAGTTHPQTTATHQSDQTAAKPKIVISMFAFTTPKSVAPGAKIKIINKDAVAHTVTSDTGGVFDIPAPAHSTVTMTAPTKKGTYAFHCKIHTTMHGSLKDK
jgi:plastocyanin